MTQSRNYKHIASIRRGEVITARYLGSVAAAINANSKALSGPRQQYALEESETGASGGVQLVNLDFSETSRTSTTASIVDDNGDTIQIEQIDEVTLENSDGNTLILRFTNP